MATHANHIDGVEGAPIFILLRPIGCVAQHGTRHWGETQTPSTEAQTRVPFPGILQKYRKA
jgi:hypothetical protein